MRRWSEKQFEKTLRINVKDYASVIAVAALYKKLYGKFPKIGLSGCQAEMADAILKGLPKSKND